MEPSVLAFIKNAIKNREMLSINLRSSKLERYIESILGTCNEGQCSNFKDISELILRGEFLDELDWLLATEISFTRDCFFNWFFVNYSNSQNIFLLIERWASNGFYEMLTHLDRLILSKESSDLVKDRALIWQAQHSYGGAWRDFRVAGIPFRRPLRVSPQNKTLRVGFLSSKFSSKMMSSQSVYLDFIFSGAPKNIDIYLLSLKTYDEQSQAIYRQSQAKFIDLSQKTVIESAASIDSMNLDFIVDLSGCHEICEHINIGRTVSVFGGVTFREGIYDFSLCSKGHRGPTDKSITEWVETDVLFSVPPHDIRRHTMISPPQLAVKKITFGIFSRLIKWSPEFYDVVARLLRFIPESRLAISFIQMNDLSATTIRNGFERRGVASSRLFFLPRTSPDEHYKKYDVIDVVLDSFPQGGGLSVFDALYMGVPVISLDDGQRWRNGGPSFVEQLNYGGLARSQLEYENLAIRISHDINFLKKFRANSVDSLTAIGALDRAAYSKALYHALEKLR